MAGRNNQAWITTVLSNKDVEAALLLCCSLRQSGTTRRIAAIASAAIDAKLRPAIDYEFDFVFYMNETENPTNLSFQDFTKIYALFAMRTFDLCVFVVPTLMALKNCDEIFTLKTKSFLLLKDNSNLPIFLFKPNASRYAAVITGLNEFASQTDETCLDACLQRYTLDEHKNIKHLPEKFYCLLTKNAFLLAFEEDIFMADLKEFSSSSSTDFETTGLLGKQIGIFRQKLLAEQVLPRLKNKTAVDLPPTMERVTNKEPIAIVGMACRCPGANNPEEFWDALLKGKDCTGTPPDFRWTQDQCPGLRSVSRKANAGFLNVPVDEFDRNFFGYSNHEVEIMDPQHRLIHELVWEALEHACINPHQLRNTSGSVFLGSWTMNYKDIIKNLENMDMFRLHMGNSISAASARISVMLGITGPSVSTESGCSSAMVAVHLACQNLLDGETNLALACGVNLMLIPNDLSAMVSPDGHCKTFSEDANGFARAEGGGVLVLKRLSDAVKDGDYIWALIRGSAISQEGFSKDLITPTVQCQAEVMENALKKADILPEQVTFVEAHGTGTEVGDPLEVNAIKQAYYSPTRKQPLVIGSVKTNLGHTESYSGITGIMKVVLSMQNEIIPKHINFTKLNPACKLDSIPAVLPLEQMNWKKCKEIRRIAGVSSFGITGSYAHVIVEESPEQCKRKPLSVNEVERPWHLLKLSAKSPEAMDILFEKYRDALTGNENSMADIAYSANIGRADFSVRAAIIAKTATHASTQIAKKTYFRENDASLKKMGKICLLFTGQGSQFPGMAKELYETCPVFQIYFDYAANIMLRKYNLDIVTTIWSPNSNYSDINKTLYSQTSIFCVEYALMKLWESWGIKPDYVLGHSLGEFAAAVCAGILTFEDALKLVVSRSKLIEGLPQGKMLVVNGNREHVNRLMQKAFRSIPEKYLEYAAINSEEQTVLAGDTESVNQLAVFCKEQGVKCTILNSSHAFHSKHMDPILEEYATVAQTLTKKQEASKVEYISGVKGNILKSSSVVSADYWVQHTREPVHFLAASQAAVMLGCKVFLEIGPQPVLTALTLVNNETDKQLVCLPSIKKSEQEWETLLSTLGQLYVKGMDINWHGVDMFQQRNKVKLPLYPFIGVKCWPKLDQNRKTIIHPLIGYRISNASSAKLFESEVRLRNHAWMNDHRIGRHVVFPGAAYLEMCLAAALATVQGMCAKISDASLIRPLKIENLSILSPMEIHQTKCTKLQTIAKYKSVAKSPYSNDDRNYHSFKIYEWCGEVNRMAWKPHATAICHTLLNESERQRASRSVDINGFIQGAKNQTQIVEKTYNKLATFGLYFGPMFQNIENLWLYCDESKGPDCKQVLAKLKSYQVEYVEPKHILHPTIIDAMIQVLWMLKMCQGYSLESLLVPIKIDKFFLFSGKFDADKLYVHAFENRPADQTIINNELNAEHCTAILLNETGNVVAQMDGIHFSSTTSVDIEAILDQPANPLPQLWEEQWRQGIKVC